jgi:hypothetical protein
MSLIPEDAMSQALALVPDADDSDELPALEEIINLIATKVLGGDEIRPVLQWVQAERDIRNPPPAAPVDPREDRIAKLEAALAKIAPADAALEPAADPRDAQIAALEAQVAAAGAVVPPADPVDAEDAAPAAAGVDGPAAQRFAAVAKELSEADATIAKLRAELAAANADPAPAAKKAAPAKKAVAAK